MCCIPKSPFRKIPPENSQEAENSKEIEMEKRLWAQHSEVKAGVEHLKQGAQGHLGYIRSTSPKTKNKNLKKSRIALFRKTSDALALLPFSRDLFLPTLSLVPGAHRPRGEHMLLHVTPLTSGSRRPWSPPPGLCAHCGAALCALASYRHQSRPSHSQKQKISGPVS